jgi:hypothetical protein
MMDEETVFHQKMAINNGREEFRKEYFLRTVL